MPLTQMTGWVRRNGFAVLVAFVILFGIVWTQTVSGFPDPDSFYHAKMAIILRDDGIIHKWPAFAYTSFPEHFVDHHLLYHYLLIPFVTFFDPLVGIRIVAGLGAASVFGLLFWILKRLRVPHSHWFVLAAAASVFFFRLSLPKAIAPALFLFLLGIWLVLSGRHIWLLVLSAAYVWLYDGWPIMMAVAICFAAADLVAARLTKGKADYRTSGKTIGAVGAGLAVGYVLNPYFLDRIHFDVLQIGKMALWNAPSLIRVGGEWNSVGFMNLLANIPWVVVFFLGTLACWFVSIVKFRPVPDKESLKTLVFFSLLAAGSMAFSFKSQRFFEYSVPLSIILSGLLWKQAWPWVEGVFLKGFSNKQMLTAALGTCMIVVFGSQLREQHANGNDYALQDFRPAAEWIQAHVPPNEIVFHLPWDFSLILWYLDDTHRYVVGLDPRFLQDFDERRARAYGELMIGEGDPGLIPALFDAHVLVYNAPSAIPFTKQLEAAGWEEVPLPEGDVHLFIQKGYESRPRNSDTQ
ncbi:hypothetical protein HYV73_04060 [Candidatus Uhrbacteria bacterium]|nr:hypothetical protein [Candidatus Uhrbacteria bacterium]